MNIDEQVAALKVQIDALAALQAAPAGDEFTTSLDALNAFAKSAIALGNDPNEITIDAPAEVAVEIETDEEVDGAIDAFPIVKSIFAAIALQSAKLDALRSELHASRQSDGVMAKAVSLVMGSQRDLEGTLAAWGAAPAGRKATVTPLVKSTPLGIEGEQPDPRAALRGRALQAKCDAMFTKGLLTATEVSAVETFV